MKIINPILKGFNPDPSIIRVDDTYYIATSTFEWFPGVQIHESKDLINWKLITHPLSTTKLLDIRGNLDSGGVWAPDLSYADGKFWLVYSDVKVVEGNFKDCTNYLTTADDIYGPWSDPIKLNGVGFDASLFHDTDGRKYLLQMEWDHREYKHSFKGIMLTEYSHKNKTLLPNTAKNIWKGTDVKLTEAPHLYKMFGYYYLFCAEGGTTYSHQEVVARSKNIYGEYEPQKETFLGAFASPDNYLQKCGHGSLVETQNNEYYFAHLVGRPWNRDTESKYDPMGWCTLGRETAIQKVQWDEEKWPYIVGGKQGSKEVDAPVGVEYHPYEKNYLVKDDFDEAQLNIHFNTLRVPFTEEIGVIKDGYLQLNGLASLSSLSPVAFVARRWQAFDFIAETKVSFRPNTHQQMAGLANYYNSKHWSKICITYAEEQGRVIEVMQYDRGILKSYLKDQAISIPENIEDVYFRVEVNTESYTYKYSFDGEDWKETGVLLDSAILSDDYVNQSYGGFFTGAFVGMVNVDYSGYELPAKFDYFIYDELE